VARTFLSTINKIAREMERAERTRIREAEHKKRENEREARRHAIAERAAYLTSRESETRFRNEQLEEQIDDLKNILISRIGYDPVADFKKLFKTVDKEAIDVQESFRVPENPDIRSFLPRKPNILIRWLPGLMGNFRKKSIQAKARFDEAKRTREEIIWKRSDALIAMKREADAYNNSILSLANGYASGDIRSVAEYFELTLLLSRYPEPIQLDPKAAYVPESKQLVAEIELPTIATAVPSAEKYRYIKKTNEILETPKSEKSRNAIYISLIAQIVIRSLYEIGISDSQHIVETIVLNAYVSTLDPATGHPVRPCLVSVRVSCETFLGFDFHHIDPVVCLKQLKASVSNQPGELLAVKPILDLNMVDPRFIQETDVISTLDQRPNLLELSPSEFESLITNLFSKMGLDTKQTQPSRDGGVDCVAFDARPILGGKVVIQAKRYKNTVGVAAVRDLFGTLHNEGASKGILVTTSGFGRASYEFANGKPIELITGSNLLYLLKEHASVDAKIEAPPDWVDPSTDVF
jgi:restriction system protein